MRALPLLLLLACTPAPPCESACGTSLPPERCDTYRATEARAVYALAPDMPRALCDALSQYEVREVPAESMPCCYGLRSNFEIHISDDAPPTTFPHEIAHVADSLRGLSGHEHWQDAGTWAAIERAAR